MPYVKLNYVSWNRLKEESGVFLLSSNSGKKFIGYSADVRHRCLFLQEQVLRGKKWKEEKQFIESSLEYRKGFAYAFHSNVRPLVHYTQSIQEAKNLYDELIDYASNKPELYYNTNLKPKSPIEIHDTHFIDYKPLIEQTIEEFKEDVVDNERVLLRIDCLGQTLFYKTKNPAKALKEVLSQILIPKRKVYDVQLIDLKKKHPSIDDFFWEMLPVKIY